MLRMIYRCANIYLVIWKSVVSMETYLVLGVRMRMDLFFFVDDPLLNLRIIIKY